MTLKKTVGMSALMISKCVQLAHSDARISVLTLHDRNNDEMMMRIAIESERLAQAGANIATLISIVQELSCQPVQGITINADGEIQIRRPNDHPLTPKIN
jgi:hypothetical protein